MAATTGRDVTNKDVMLDLVEPVDCPDWPRSNGSGNRGGCVLPCVGHVIFKLDATMIDGCDTAQ